MAGLLGNLTNTLDKTLTGGDEAKGQGGLLGAVGGVLNKTVDTAGNVVTQTVDSTGKVVSTTTDSAGNVVKQTTDGGK